MKHNVHLIAAVRVTVYNVEADTHRAAADVAMAEVEDFYSLFDRTVGEIEMEYNEDILACLVLGLVSNYFRRPRNYISMCLRAIRAMRNCD